MTRLSSVLSELSEHERELSSKLDELTAKSKETEAELANVQAALAALRGKKQPKRESGGGLTADLLASEMEAARAASAKPLSDEELRAAVKARIKAQGRSLLGIAMMWPRALSRLDGAGRRSGANEKAAS